MIKKDNDELTAIVDRMEPDSPMISRTYLRCIAREGMKGVVESKLSDKSDKQALVTASKKSIGHYFATWGDDLVKELAESFSNAYKSV